jgi:predicted glutamine amidotransferase
MCVIIHKPAGKRIKDEDIINAATRNDDGFGYMYYDPEQDKIITDKFLFNKPEDLLEIFASQVQYEVVYHLRIKTHGPITRKNCHPFKILSKEKHGQDMYFMHNGTISKVKEIEDESDTRAFNREVLKPLLKANKKIINTEAFKKLVEEFIGTSKLVFMTGTGEVIKFNERLGDTHDGMWVSNKYSFSAPVKTTYNNSKWDKDDYNYDCYGYNNSNSRIDEIIRKTTKSPVEIKLNEEILVMHNTDTKYCEIGKVKLVTATYIEVEVINLEGVLSKLWFKQSDLQSSNWKEDYYLIPYPSSTQSFTLSANEFKKEEPKIVSKNIITRKEFVLKDISFDSDLYTHDATEDLNSLTPYPVIEKGKVTTVDTSILDFYNMSKQERFDFYLDNYQTSFGMMQDLVEQMAFIDTYNGILVEKDIKNETK